VNATRRPGRRRAVGVGMAVYTAKAILLGKVGRRLEDAHGEHPLISSVEAEIATPVFHEDSDNV
jgi:hypothetical protein